jgi:hypothetical protein
MFVHLCLIYSEQSSTVASYCFFPKNQAIFHICNVFCINVNSYSIWYGIIEVSSTLGALNKYKPVPKPQNHYYTESWFVADIECLVNQVSQDHIVDMSTLPLQEQSFNTQL